MEGSHTPCVSSAGNPKRRREEDEGEGVEEESVNSDEHQPFLDQLSDHKEPSGGCQIGIQDAAGLRLLFPSSPGPVGPNMGGGRVRR